MQIFTVTYDFYPSVVSLFKPLGDVHVLPETRKNLEADLIVFTGGEDINPARYGIPTTGGYNDARDSLELSVFKQILSGKLKTQKVLGICRGMQLLNIGFGGTLYLDITQSFGKPHPYIHDIRNYGEHPLNFLTVVNSMHHQALGKIGMRYGNPITLAESVQDEVAEIVCWSDKFLGVQFHPEFFSNEIPEKQLFVEAIGKWIRKEVSMDVINKKEKKSAYYNYDFGEAERRFATSVTDTANATVDLSELVRRSRQTGGPNEF